MRWPDRRAVKILAGPGAGGFPGKGPDPGHDHHGLFSFFQAWNSRSEYQSIFRISPVSNPLHFLRDDRRRPVATGRGLRPFPAVGFPDRADPRCGMAADPLGGTGYISALRPYAWKRLEEIEKADILVGIPAFNNEQTICHPDLQPPQIRRDYHQQHRLQPDKSPVRQTHPAASAATMLDII
jgi:hypothetical protein